MRLSAKFLKGRVFSTTEMYNRTAYNNAREEATNNTPQNVK